MKLDFTKAEIAALFEVLGDALDAYEDDLPHFKEVSSAQKKFRLAFEKQ